MFSVFPSELCSEFGLISMVCAQREFVRYVYKIIVINTHTFISGSVCVVAFVKALVCSLFNADQYPQPITSRGIGTNIYIQTGLGPLNKGLFI